MEPRRIKGRIYSIDFPGLEQKKICFILSSLFSVLFIASKKTLIFSSTFPWFQFEPCVLCQHLSLLGRTELAVLLSFLKETCLYASVNYLAPSKPCFPAARVSLSCTQACHVSLHQTPYYTPDHDTWTACSQPSRPGRGSQLLWFQRPGPLQSSLKMKPHLNSMDQVVSEQAGFQLVHRWPVHVFQTAEKASVQITPVIPQGSQVVALHKLLQLLHYLIHLERAKQEHFTHGRAPEAQDFL